MIFEKLKKLIPRKPRYQPFRTTTKLDHEILRVLFEENRPMLPQEVAERIGTVTPNAVYRRMRIMNEANLLTRVPGKGWTVNLQERLFPMDLAVFALLLWVLGIVCQNWLLLGIGGSLAVLTYIHWKLEIFA